MLFIRCKEDRIDKKETNMHNQSQQTSFLLSNSNNKIDEKKKHNNEYDSSESNKNNFLVDYENKCVKTIINLNENLDFNLFKNNFSK